VDEEPKDLPILDNGFGKMLQWERDKGSDETLEFICERIAEGEKMRSICKRKGWPYSYVAKWIAVTPEATAAYQAALELWADDLAQHTLDIADESKDAKDGVGVSSAKLRVDTRMKLASRWHKARYGETPGVVLNAQSGSLIAILSSLPPLTAPEEPKVIEGESEEEK